MGILKQEKTIRTRNFPYGWWIVKNIKRDEMVRLCSF